MLNNLAVQIHLLFRTSSSHPSASSPPSFPTAHITSPRATLVIISVNTPRAPWTLVLSEHPLSFLNLNFVYTSLFSPSSCFHSPFFLFLFPSSSPFPPPLLSSQDIKPTRMSESAPHAAAHLSFPDFLSPFCQISDKAMIKQDATERAKKRVGNN